MLKWIIPCLMSLLSFLANCFVYLQIFSSSSMCLFVLVFFCGQLVRVLSITKINLDPLRVHDLFYH